MEKFLNYLGQLRIYSLADFILLLLAAHATNSELWGAILLHIGFLAYLEHCHAHSYRNRIPLAVPIVLGLTGLSLFSNPVGAGGFIVFSLLYSFKNKKYLGIFSPVARGLQFLFLIYGLTGSFTELAWLAFGALLVRNFLGDMRDVAKDRREGIMTLPVSLGFKRNWTHAHLAFLLLTTFAWWYIAGFSFVVLISLWVIEILTYKLTPR